MIQKKQSGGLDYFRLAAAFLVVAIHTSPFASLNADVDFVFTRVFARTAVPFFFMATGYFLMPQYLFRRSMDYRPLFRMLKKMIFLYMAAILLYLPVNCYAGQFRNVSVAGILRMLLTDGTFYHLWYLPAAILGIVVVFFIGGRRQRGVTSYGATAGISGILYAVGLLGDSYYGLTEQIPFLKRSFDILLAISSYTRNGLFYAPVFLVMGAGIHSGGDALKTAGKKKGGVAAPKKYLKKTDVMGFTISIVLMTAEGMTLHRLNFQRHDSMYLMLPAVMFFLFRLLLSVSCAPKKRLRGIALWIYLLHPFCIILVRGAAKALHAEEFLIGNSFLHYLAVCMISFTTAAAAERCKDRIFKYFPALWGEKPTFDRGRAWVELSRENLKMNVETLKKMLVPGQRLMAVVKADAYGHGAALIAWELQDMGVDAYCVACVSEGVALRKNGITGDILILGYTHPKEFALLHRYRLTQTVVDYAYGKVLNSYSKKLNVHLKIDTGMHRLGERSEKSMEIEEIFRMRNLRVEGVYTHLCTSETRSVSNMAFTKKQAELFYEAVDRLEKQRDSVLKTHLSASYGLVNYPELGGDYVRVGIALYGLLSDRKVKNLSAESVNRLIPVLSLKARIAVVKDLYRGESVGYGLAYTAASYRKIAVLTIGYADGLPRGLSQGRVLVHGKSAPVIGRICMDQTIVDVTGISNVKPGETAVLLGRCGGEEITVYEWAEQAGTITNEIVSGLGARLPRIMV